MNDIDEKELESINLLWKIIDEKTDKLLYIADVLEEHEINVRLEDGRYLNPVSTIRNDVDVLWDAVVDLFPHFGIALTFQKKGEESGA